MEELITFETAKLAKEKGFKEPTVDYFSHKGQEYDFYDEFNWGIPSLVPSKKGIQRPSQVLLQKWLRDHHGLIVEIMYDFTGSRLYNCVVIEMKPNGFYYPTNAIQVVSYETALEIGLKFALNLLP